MTRIDRLARSVGYLSEIVAPLGFDHAHQ
ncbi:hypothetical protein [Brevundimonas diminuta]